MSEGDRGREREGGRGEGKRGRERERRGEGGRGEERGVGEFKVDIIIKI